MIPIDATHFNPLVKSLVHVFRNAMVHGIESPEERVEMGKPERGVLTCCILRQQGHLVLEISDDGRGMDLDLLRQYGLERGGLDQSELAELPDEAVLQLIFNDDFSTTKEVDDYSGRGVGLAAVCDQVERLGGTIKVLSRKGRGSSFKFTLPLMNRLSCNAVNK